VRQRSNISVDGRAHQSRQRKKCQEVIFHKCEQPGHFASGCANTPVLAPTTAEIVSSSSEVCESNCLLPNDVYTITVNSVSNYTMSARVFGNDISFQGSCVAYFQ